MDNITHFRLFRVHHRLDVKNSFTDKACIQQTRLSAKFFSNSNRKRYNVSDVRESQTELQFHRIDQTFSFVNFGVKIVKKVTRGFSL